jgi:hypothetical protein
MGGFCRQDHPVKTQCTANNKAARDRNREPDSMNDPDINTFPMTLEGHEMAVSCNLEICQER